MQVRPVFSAADVEAGLERLAARLYRDYADSPLSLVCIAEGAQRFVDGLCERLSARGLHPEVHVIRARRTRGRDLGSVQVDAFDPGVLEDRDVLVVDDVIDEGATLRAVLEIVSLSETRSLRTAVLVEKGARARGTLTPDYVGFRVDGGWVVGFGMDLAGEFRDLDEIGIVADET